MRTQQKQIWIPLGSVTFEVSLQISLFVVEEPNIDESCFDGCMAKLRNWAAQEPDGIQGFWIKRFTASRSVVLAHFTC